MKLNTEKFLPLAEGHDLVAETGLMKRSVDWCLSGKSCTYEAIEKLCLAVGVSPAEVTMVDYDEDVHENVIEFERNQATATLTLCQGRFIGKIRKLAQERPEACQIVAENSDGTIVAHMPVDWIKFRPEMELTDEQREALSERGKRMARENFKREESAE